MSRQEFTKVICDGCGKTRDCLPKELERERAQVWVPSGWLIISASVKNEWIGEYGEVVLLPLSTTAGNRGLSDHHVCSRACAVTLLGRFVELVSSAKELEA